MIGALVLHGHSSQVVLGVGSTQQRKNMMTRLWKKQSQEEEPDDGVEIPADQQVVLKTRWWSLAAQWPLKFMSENWFHSCVDLFL